MTRSSLFGSSRRLGVPVVLATASALLLTGCGGDEAPAGSVTPAEYGVVRYAGPVRILNAIGFPAAPPARVNPVLHMAIANDAARPDQLTGIELVSADGSGPAPGRVELLGERDIPAGGVLLVSSAASSTIAYVCGTELREGAKVSITLRFARAAPVTNLTTTVAPVGGYNEGQGLALRLPEQPVMPPCPA